MTHLFSSIQPNCIKIVHIDFAGTFDTWPALLDLTSKHSLVHLICHRHLILAMFSMAVCDSFIFLRIGIFTLCYIAACSCLHFCQNPLGFIDIIGASVCIQNVICVRTDAA